MGKKDKAVDPFQKELQKGFKWTTEHTRLVTIVVLAFIVIAGGLGIKSYFDTKKEMEAQTAYFPLEKVLLEKRSQFMAADEPSPNKKAPMTAVKASGDFSKDYGTEAQALDAFINKYPSSKAAQMAALNLSTLQNEYKQFAEAEKTLEKVNSDASTLISGLVLSELGNAKANLNDCQNAIDTWNKVLRNKNAAFLQSSVKLKQALCYEALKNPEKAKSLYAEIKASDKEGNLGKTADKYIRLLGTTATSAANDVPKTESPK